jgi:hypothetical protein
MPPPKPRCSLSVRSGLNCSGLAKRAESLLSDLCPLLARLSADMRFDEVSELHRRLVAGGRVARKLGEPMGQIRIVHIGEIVPGSRKFLRVGVSHIAQRVETVRDKDRRRQVGMRFGVHGSDVGLASIIRVLEVIAYNLIDAVRFKIEPGPILAPRQCVARKGGFWEERHVQGKLRTVLIAELERDDTGHVAAFGIAARYHCGSCTPQVER